MKLSSSTATGASGLRAVSIVAGTLLAGSLLAGCGQSQPAASPTPSAPPTSTEPSPTSAQPSPTRTKSAREKAIAEATVAIEKYEQMWGEILHDKTPNLNDMNLVATGEQLDISLSNLQKLYGTTTVNDPGRIVVVSATPTKIALAATPPSVTLEACVDQTSRKGTDSGGTAWSGPRELMSYVVVKTKYLPAPGWAVSKVLPPRGSDGPRKC